MKQKLVAILKIIIASVAALLLLSITVEPVIAQEPAPFVDTSVGKTQEISDPALKISMSEGIQVYPTKRFPITLTIDSAIDSNRIGINWIYPNDAFLIEGEVTDVLTVSAGQRTTFTKYFLSRKEYKSINPSIKFGFGVRVHGVVAAKNYISSTEMSLTFNNELEKLPVDGNYTRDKTVAAVISWIEVIALISVIIAIIVLIVRRFKAYLNSPDEDA
jgi:hypothetical protein